VVLRRLVRALFTGVAVASALAWPSSAAAHFELSVYTQRSCFGTDADPVTNVLWDSGSARLATDHVEHHTGWTNEQGSQQWFTSHARCHEAFAQRASGGPFSSRYHVRISPTLDLDPWTYSAAAAHHEDFTYCGHAVDKTVNGWSGFDAGRRAVYEALRGHHAYSYVNYGNSRQFKQCDGDYAGSNGIVGWWRIQGFSGRRAAAVRASSADMKPGGRARSPPLPVFWVGRWFEGHALAARTTASGTPQNGEGGFAARYASFVYGDCTPVDGGCPPPLEIQVWPACVRALADYRVTPFSPELLPHRRLVRRGVPAALFAEGAGLARLELYSGAVTIVIFGTEEAELLRAAGALRRYGGDVRRRALPSPLPGAMVGTLEC
jgi:hypothetical protein